MNQEILNAIEQKYLALGENPEIYLKGLLETKLITYWDYIQTDTLLSLQKPRTEHPDEEIFIMYHQVTELVLKLMIHEIKQISGNYIPEEKTLIQKLTRLCRYTGLLINSFDIMRVGMDYDQYNIFRNALTPASGFQSAQFREVEILCTPLINLIHERKREKLGNNPGIRDYFQQVYWKDAGHNPETNKITMTLQQFEKKYLDQFVLWAENIEGNTVADKLKQILDGASDELKKAAKQFDKTYNIEWPLVHLQTAQHFLDSKGEQKTATGGSEWKKYLHPKFQRRMFFPFLYSEAELNTWGED